MNAPHRRSSLGFRVLFGLALAVPPAVALDGGPVRAGFVPLGPLIASVPGQGSYGTIKGRLVWGGPEAPKPKILVPKGKADKDPSVCGATAPLLDRKLIVDPSTKGVKYAFAYLVRPKGENPDAVKSLVAKHEKLDLDQKSCEFLPYSLALHQDQTVVFKSSDAVNHNIHLSPFNNAPFNTIIAPGSSLEKKFVAERRVIPLSCDIHPWMKGWLMVFDHPFFAVTSDDGSFEISGVPAGEQSVVIWQEAGGYVNAGLAKGMPVSVKAGETTDLGEVKLDPARVKN